MITWLSSFLLGFRFLFWFWISHWISTSLRSVHFAWCLIKFESLCVHYFGTLCHSISHGSLDSNFLCRGMFAVLWLHRFALFLHSTHVSINPCARGSFLLLIQLLNPNWSLPLIKSELRKDLSLGLLTLGLIHSWFDLTWCLATPIALLNCSLTQDWVSVGTQVLEQSWSCLKQWAFLLNLLSCQVIGHSDLKPLQSVIDILRLDCRVCSGRLIFDATVHLLLWVLLGDNRFAHFCMA